MASAASSTCLVTDTTHVCSIVDITIQLTHDKTISSKEVRHAILSYVDIIDNEFDFNQYIGDVALETKILLSLSAVSILSQHFNSDDFESIFIPTSEIGTKPR